MSCPPERGEQNVANFYVSFSPMHADGRLPICSKCIQNICFDEATGEIDTSKLKDILRQMDKPYIEKVYNSAVEQYNKTYSGKNVPPRSRTRIIGYYFKNINTLFQYVALKWKDGVELNNSQQSTSQDGVKMVVENRYEPREDRKDEERRFYLDEDDSFVVTSEMVNLFGKAFKDSEYKAMWDKYNFLRKSYADFTNLHTEALVSYVRFKVKEEAAVAAGNPADAEKWANLARNAADKARINPSQLNQSDLQGGLNSFSELLMAVEQAVDVIPILPHFKYRPNDAIDFNIWCMVNYIRDLEGKPLCDYADVYRFYDERKEAFIAQYGDQYGIFTDDTTKANRENIERFIKMPADFKDSD